MDFVHKSDQLCKSALALNYNIVTRLLKTSDKMIYYQNNHI
jgi:hypothetical protein